MYTTLSYLMEWFGYTEAEAQSIVDKHLTLFHRLEAERYNDYAIAKAIAALEGLEIEVTEKPKADKAEKTDKPKAKKATAKSEEGAKA